MLQTLVDVHEYGIDNSKNLIYIESYGETEIGIDHRVAARFIKNLQFLDSELDKREEIDIILLTGIGGDWLAGMAMFDTIKSCKHNTNFYVPVFACSMCSILPQAATKRYISPNAGLMIHNLSIDAAGDISKTLSESRYYTKENEKMIDIFAKRSNLSASKIKKNINRHKDWYVTAEECVEFGLMDGVHSY